MPLAHDGPVVIPSTPDESAAYLLDTLKLLHCPYKGGWTYQLANFASRTPQRVSDQASDGRKSLTRKRKSLSTRS